MTIMYERTYRFLALVFSIYLLIVGQESAYGANYIWNQTDWSGGISADPASCITAGGVWTGSVCIAVHPANQTGWNIFFAQDPNIETTIPGEITLAPVSTASIDTDFQGGIADNIDIIGSGEGAYLKVRDFSIDFGSAVDGDLVIDGKIAGNSSDGNAYPMPVNSPANFSIRAGCCGNFSEGTYYYRVVAFNAYGESLSTTASFRYSGAGGKLILQWAPVPCADGYRIYGRGESNQDIRYGPLATVAGGVTTWEDVDRTYQGISATPSATGGVLTGGTYEYKITAFNENGETIIGTIRSTLPSTSSGSITLSWNSVEWASRPDSGYKVYGRGGLLTPSGITETTYTDTGAFTPGTPQIPNENNVSDGSLRIDTVREYNNVSVQNCGALSASKAAIMGPPAIVSVNQISGIDGPDGTFYYVVTAVDRHGLESQRSSPDIGITISGINAAEVSWSPVSGAVGYRVYRRSTSAFESPALVCSATSTSCIDNKATPDYGAPPVDTAALPTPTLTASRTGGSMLNGIYYYVITAIDTNGRETTQGGSRTISFFYPSPANTASVRVDWLQVPGATGYRVYRTTVAGLYNSPSLVCEVNDPSILSCTDVLGTPVSGAPPRSYYHAIAGGSLNLKVSDTLSVDATSTVYLNGKGYPGGEGVVSSTSTGNPGKGPGAGGNRGGGAGYRDDGSNNTSGTANIGYSYGDDLISVLYSGSGGASGSREGGRSGDGGNGGGAARIDARNMVVNGEIKADGGAGRDGIGSRANGGGGGSGGSLTIGLDSISGSGVISSIGGNGGTYGQQLDSEYDRGGGGSVGRIRLASSSLISCGGISCNPAPITGNRGIYESRPFELDSGGVSFSTLSWTASVPPGGNLKFQIATNNDNSTWNFIGPDGTEGSYYQVSGGAINSIHNGDRFIKYRAYLESTTISPLDSPVLYDVSVAYSFTDRWQRLASSFYDTTDPGNSINRWQWSEDITAGSDVATQMRTCPGSGASGSDPCLTDAWSAWYGPNSTTFSASAGSSDITVASAAGFTAGSRVTLTDATESGFLNPSKFEIKEIVSISGNTITLNSGAAYTYAAGSILTDFYTDPSGTEAINGAHRDGSGDRWIQYRVYLFTDNAQNIPRFMESRIGYQTVNAIYQPDGIIEGNGNVDPPRSLPYASAGTGAGGSAAKFTDMGTRVDFSIEVQNDGAVEGIDDRYTLSWNTPSDISGSWLAVLSDGISDYPSPLTTVSIPVGSSIPYTLKVTPSPNAPALSVKDVIIDIRSESDYEKVDSIKATVNINTSYLADGLIDGNGDNIYDTDRGGNGGISLLKNGGPGDTVSYDITLQNEGNIQDAYTFSLLSDPPPGWKVFINDGSKDYDITNPSLGWTTPSIPSPPDSGSSTSYTLNVIPSGQPVTASLILVIYSNGGSKYVDSLTARLNLGGDYRVDGVIYGIGYDTGGEIKDYGVIGAGCGPLGPGDDIYGATGSGDGGCTAIDITPGTDKNITVGIQNEGNIPDSYEISWNTSPNLTIVMQNGDPSINYQGGEVPFFTFNIAASPAFSGSETIIFDIKSTGDNTKVDSVKAVINSRDTTPPSPVALSMDNVTSTSVRVSWTAPGDDGTGGTATSYDLRYSTAPITEANFSEATKVSSLGKPKPGGSAESFTVLRLFADTDYYFALKTSDEAGNASPISTCPGCPVHTAASFDVTKPEAITDLTVTEAAKDTVTLCWTAPEDIDIEGLVFFDDLSDGALSPWSQLQSGIVGVVDDGGNYVLRKTVNADPNGGWAPLSQTLGDFNLTLYTRRVTSNASAPANRYSLTDTGGNGYGLYLNFSDGMLYMERRSAWTSTILGTASAVSGGLTVGQWYTLKLTKEGQSLTANVYLGRVDPATAAPAATVSASDGTWGSFSQVNVNGGFDYDTDDILVSAPSAGNISGPATGYELRYSTRQIVEDGTAPGVGQVTFSDAKTVIPVGGFSPPKSPGVKECYIAPVENKIDTGGGIEDNRTRNTRFYFAIKALDEARNKSFLSNIAGGLTPLAPYAYNMVSVPYVPNPSSPQDVFGDDVGAPLYVYWWDSRGPNFESGCYDGEPGPYSSDPAKYTCSKLTSIKEALGYFLWVPPGNITLDVPSGSALSPAQGCVDDAGITFQCYVFSLQEGWNMIGASFDKEINFTSRDIGGAIERGIYVRGMRGADVQIATFQNAVTAEKWIDSSIYTYNGSNYTYEVCDQDKTGETLGTGCSLVIQPWKAYWIKVVGSARFDTFELLIPY